MKPWQLVVGTSTLVLVAAVSPPALASTPSLGHLRLVTVSTVAGPADSWSTGPSISANGRYVAFTSVATDLVPGDTNGTDDVFVRDLRTGTTVRASVSSSGTQANDSSVDAAISPSGRFVAFSSAATNLVRGHVAPGVMLVYLHDLATGTTTLVSTSTAGVRPGASTLSRHPSVSWDGRFVTFFSTATNLVPHDTNNADDVFVRDLRAGTTTRVSVSSAGRQGDSSSDDPVISADGRFVAWYSTATNLVPGTNDGLFQVYVRDRWTRTTTRVSVPGSAGHGWGAEPSISADGRWVGFSGQLPGDAVKQVYLHDQKTGTYARVSVGVGGRPGDDASQFSSVSPDGRFVGFVSSATDLVAGDTNQVQDTFVRDMVTRTTYRVDVTDAGVQVGFDLQPPAPSLSRGGIVAFTTEVGLLPVDTNDQGDVYVRAVP